MMAIEFNFKTSCETESEGTILPHEVFALLDWAFGELTAPQTEEYGRRCAYPDSLRDAAKQTDT